MSLLEKIFGCCERSKLMKKSDINLLSIKKEKEKETINYLPNITQTKNTVKNRPSFTNSSPLITLSFSSKNFNNNNNTNTNDINRTEKKTGAFIKSLQTTIKIKDDQPIDKSKLHLEKKVLRPTKTVVCKRDNDQNYILSLSDISFISENNGQKEKKEKENFSKLLLTGDLFFNKEIIINECGMINSKRNKKDGYTMFGLNNSLDISGQLNNDFIINFKKDMEDIGNVETETGRVFEIKFNKEKKEYTLYFINPYLYLYYKINNFVYFYPGRDYFLFVGKIFIYITIEKKGGVQKINIQIDNTCKEGENPEESNKKYSFNENKGIITIGRINCDINICEKCISKNHGIIEYSKINQKFYYKDMSSTNGTTLLVKKGDFLKIKGEMNFKLEDVSFKIQEIP
jgi:hypothetical protein